MDLPYYIRVIAARWKTITAITLAGLLLAAAATLLQPKQYASTLKFFVSTSSSDSNAQLAQGATFTQDRVKTYSQVLKTRRVLDPIVQHLNLAGGRDELSAAITATVPPDSVLISVTVTNHSPKRADAIAQELSKTFPTVVDELETTKGDSSPIKVSVVDQPTASRGAVSPRPVPNMILGLVLGLLLGVAFALLRDRLDTTVRTKEDVEDVTDTPVIGGVPFDSAAPEHPLIVQEDPHSLRAEAMRSVRTNLQFMDADTPIRSLVITSSIPGEGKTTTAANLALALAETNARVCVIEGDLRRPRLLSYLGLEGAVGLTDVLVGRVELDDVLQPFGASGMSVLGAGHLPPNPSELLGSDAMKRLLVALGEKFDYVIIDAPPLLPVTDGAVVSTLVDGALVVVGAGITNRGQLDTALEMLENVGTGACGLVINRIARAKSGQGYYDYRYEYTQDQRTSPQGESQLRRLRTRRRTKR